MKKKLLGGLAIIVVLFAIGVGLVFFYLNGIARAGVTRGGSSVLGVPVTLKEAEVSLNGIVGLEGLTVGSPADYEADPMFRFRHARVDADYMSFLSDEIILRDVVIDEPEVTVELSGGKTNWAVLLQGLESKSEEVEKGTTMRIDHIVFRNGKVHIVGLPTGEVTVPLPTVELKNIGKGDAKTVPETILMVAGGLYAAILQTKGDALPTEQVKKLTEGISGGIGDAVVRIGETRGGLDDAAGDAAGTANDVLGGIFGGGEEKDEDDAEEKQQ